MNALGSFGRSRARRVEAGTTKVTFKDVAGIDEAKSELTEVVDYLKNPDRYRRLGGQDPARRAALRAPRHRQDAARPRRGGGGGRAVLLHLGVGVRGGDRRHRRLPRPRPLQAGQGGVARDHLRRRARRDRPRAHRRQFAVQRRQRRARADAQPDPHGDGRLRDRRGGDRPRAPPTAPRSSTRRCCAPAASTAASPSRRPTRTAAARSSRSTRARSRSTTNVNLDSLAASTPGMVGADLANLCNEAALLAARRDHEKVQQSRTSRSRWRRSCSAPRAAWCSPRRTAAAPPTTRSGHALVGMLTPGADPVRKVSIIPRGMALGVTLSAPDIEKLQLRGAVPARAASRSRSAAAWRRRSCTARSPPARSPTSSS